MNSLYANMPNPPMLNQLCSAQKSHCENVCYRPDSPHEQARGGLQNHFYSRLCWINPDTIHTLHAATGSAASRPNAIRLALFALSIGTDAERNGCLVPTFQRRTRRRRSNPAMSIRLVASGHHRSFARCDKAPARHSFNEAPSQFFLWLDCGEDYRLGERIAPRQF